MFKVTCFEKSVRRRAYNYGYSRAFSALYSSPDVALRRLIIQSFRVVTGDTDPVYCACIALYPRKFVREQLSVSAKKLFSGEALNGVKAGIDAAFDDFLREKEC